MVIEREIPAMQVTVMTPPREPVAAPPPPPVPRLRAPEIHLPDVPAPVITLRIEETSRPEPPAPVVAAVSAPARPVPAPTPALTPPRGDLAYLDNPAPSYPAASRRAREQGRVVLRVRVDAAGQVETLEVQASSGHSRLDEAALAAVRRWRFVSARLGEQPVAGWALVPVSFSLDR